MNILQKTSKWVKLNVSSTPHSSISLVKLCIRQTNKDNSTLETDVDGWGQSQYLIDRLHPGQEYEVWIQVVLNNNYSVSTSEIYFNTSSDNASLCGNNTEQSKMEITGMFCRKCTTCTSYQIWTVPHITRNKAKCNCSQNVEWSNINKIHSLKKKTFFDTLDYQQFVFIFPVTASSNSESHLYVGLIVGILSIIAVIFSAQICLILKKKQTCSKRETLFFVNATFGVRI